MHILGPSPKTMIDPNKMYKKIHKKGRGFELDLLDLKDLLLCQIKTRLNFFILYFMSFCHLLLNLFLDVSQWCYIRKLKIKFTDTNVQLCRIRNSH